MWRALLLALIAMTASAQTANALLCSPLTGCSCTVVADDIGFNNVNPLSGAASAQGDLHIDCTGVADIAPAVTVSINAGTWGTINARKMHASSGALLSYNIYTTVGHGTVWGNGTSGNSTVSVSGGLITLGHWTATRTMFAGVAPTVTTTPGSYTDTVVVRVDY